MTTVDQLKQAFSDKSLDKPNIWIRQPSKKMARFKKIVGLTNYTELNDEAIERELSSDCCIGYRVDIHQYLKVDKLMYKFVKIECFKERLLIEFEQYEMLELRKSKKGELIYNVYNSKHYRPQRIGIIQKQVRKKYKRISNGTLALDMACDYIKL